VIEHRSLVLQPDFKFQSMNQIPHQPAPPFTTHDVYETELDLGTLQGKKIYLAFERNAGCPVCNLRTHELLKHQDNFKAQNVIVILIYESSAEKMREYLGDTPYPFHFVADPQNRLYNLYGVQRSIIKVFRGLFHGLLTKVKAGTKLFKEPMKQDGHLDRVPAEFLIDEQGKLSLVHYGKFVGDHLPVDVILKQLR